MDGLMCTDDKELTKSVNLKRPSLSMVTTWMNEALEDIHVEMMKKSFLRTGISNIMDGTKDGHLWQDSGELSSSEEETWDTTGMVPRRHSLREVGMLQRSAKIVSTKSLLPNMGARFRFLASRLCSSQKWMTTSQILTRPHTQTNTFQSFGFVTSVINKKQTSIRCNHTH